MDSSAGWMLAILLKSSPALSIVIDHYKRERTNLTETHPPHTDLGQSEISVSL